MLSLAIATTSVFVGRQLHDQLGSATSQLAKSRSQEEQASRSVSELRSVLQADSSDIQINQAFATTIAEVMRLRLPYAVTVSSVTPHKNAGNTGLANTENLKEPVPHSKLSGIRVNVRGTYSSLSDFMGYLGALRELPLSIVYFKVDDRNFELGLRIYGN